jgi:hypothetical protein
VSQPLLQFGLKAIQFGLFFGGQTPAAALPDQLNSPLVLAIPSGRQAALPDGFG